MNYITPTLELFFYKWIEQHLLTKLRYRSQRFRNFQAIAATTDTEH